MQIRLHRFNQKSGYVSTKVMTVHGARIVGVNRRELAEGKHTNKDIVVGMVQKLNEKVSSAKNGLGELGEAS